MATTLLQLLSINQLRHQLSDIKQLRMTTKVMAAASPPPPAGSTTTHLDDVFIKGKHIIVNDWTRQAGICHPAPKAFNPVCRHCSVRRSCLLFSKCCRRYCCCNFASLSFASLSALLSSLRCCRGHQHQRRRPRWQYHEHHQRHCDVIVDAVMRVSRRYIKLRNVECIHDKIDDDDDGGDEDMER